MRHILIVAALVSLFGGAVGGAGAYFAMAKAAPVRSKERIQAETRARFDLPSKEQVEEASDAEERMRKIEHRIALLSRALPHRNEGASDGLAQESNSNQGVVATDVADPVFEAAVLDIMDREESRKTEERDAWRNELRVERSRRFATELEKPLGLSPQQRDQIADVIQAHFQELQALRDSPDRPVTRRQWVERSEALQKKLEEGLKSTLTPAQYSSYEALSEEDKIGFGWGRR